MRGNYQFSAANHVRTRRVLNTNDAAREHSLSDAWLRACRRERVAFL